MEQEISTIAAARANTTVGTVFTVEGTVTAGNVEPNAFYDTIYIQDATGGINIYPVAPTDGTFQVGQRVQVSGSWDQYQGDVELRVQDRLLTGPAGAHTLSQRECALLELFLRNPGVTLPRERILLNVWGPDSDVESGNIDNYIHLVRRRLRLVGSRMELVTRRGAGYRLEADPC